MKRTQNKPPRMSRRRITSFAKAHRDRERESRDYSNLALHPDPPAMELHKLPTQGKPQPGALDLLGRRPDLAELLEHRLLILRGDAHSGIADSDLYNPILWLGPDFNPSALWRELDRIR